MNVTCPNCDTEFSVPDQAYKPGRKARCAICSHVFPLPEVPGLNAGSAQAETPPRAEEAPSATAKSLLDDDMDAVLGQAAVEAEVISENETGKAGKSKKDKKGKKDKAGADKPKKSKKRLIFLLIAVLVLGAGGYLAYDLFLAAPKVAEPELGPDAKISDLPVEVISKVSRLDVKSGGVKYEYIKNDKLGAILVLQGRVVNHFDSPKDYITVEAKLLNSKGEVLKAQKQVCGVLLTELQLTALGQRELAKALNNRIEIMANNVNVMPGQDVPFMVVFVYPPSSAVDMEVSVVDASDPPGAGARP